MYTETDPYDEPNPYEDRNPYDESNAWTPRVTYIDRQHGEWEDMGLEPQRNERIDPAHGRPCQRVIRQLLTMLATLIFLTLYTLGKTESFMFEGANYLIGTVKMERDRGASPKTFGERIKRIGRGIADGGRDMCMPTFEITFNHMKISGGAPEIVGGITNGEFSGGEIDLIADKQEGLGNPNVAEGLRIGAKLTGVCPLSLFA